MLNSDKGNGFIVAEVAFSVITLATLTTTIAPIVIKNVEKTKVNKDNAAMQEIVNTIDRALIDADVYGEINKYVITNNFNGYDIKDTAVPTGEMKGITITFPVTKVTEQESVIRLDQGVINEMPGTYQKGSPIRALERKYNDMNTISLRTLSHPTADSKLYQTIRQQIELAVPITSKTYSDADYTVFISIVGSGVDKRIDVYGEWNKTAE